jgi:hypothetical protein
MLEHLRSNCDIGDADPGRVLTMEVTSGDEDKKMAEFRKRLYAAGMTNYAKMAQFFSLI